MIEASLGEERVRARGVFDPAEVRRVLDENASGSADHAYLIYALLTFELWSQSFLDRPGEGVAF